VPAPGPAVLPSRPSDAEWRGILLPGVLEKLRPIAEEPDEHLRDPTAAEALAGLAWLRSPAVRAARERAEAARAGYRLATELEDLAALYRSFEEKPAPGMPYLGISTLSGEIVNRSVDIAFEDLRAVVRETVAEALTLHAEGARLVAARSILGEELALERDLMEVLEARLESGEESQAALLAFRASVERLQTELAILEEREPVIRARMNRLLDRPPEAPVALGGAGAAGAETELDVTKLTALAGRERQELRRASFAVERARAALRIAETMALPHSSFPGTAPPTGARPDFGVRAGQVEEMRARLRAFEAAREETEGMVAAEVRSAAFEVSAAGRRVTLFRTEVVPLARKAVDAVRGAYEGNRAGYLDLLEAVRRLLQARLELADAARDLARARAGLLGAVGVRPRPGE
jgi:outer membrane protein TolC